MINELVIKRGKASYWSNPSWGPRRSGGGGVAVVLCLRVLGSGMENAKGDRFISNGLGGAGC